MVFGVTSWTFLEDLSPASPCTLPLIFQSQAPGRTMPFHGYGPSLSFFPAWQNPVDPSGHFSHVTPSVTFFHDLKAIYYNYKFYRIGIICLQISFPTGQRPFLSVFCRCNIQCGPLTTIEAQYYLISNFINCQIMWNTCRDYYKVLIPVIPVLCL